MQSNSVITRQSEVVRSPRVVQIEGIFDVAPSEISQLEWNVNLPLDEKDWNIGLIVGPSGCGKSTIASELFPGEIIEGFKWPEKKSVLDGFPKKMGIKDIVALLSSVSFSSPPAWVRPFNVLSTGQQFRVNMARALAEKPDMAVVDEFTSVVDRNVAKTTRKRNQKFIAVSCHYDILEWLQPDWVYEPAGANFQWRRLRRFPEINLTISRVDKNAWELFKPYHYLTGKLNKSAKCFIAFWGDIPVAFVAYLNQPHPKVKNRK